MKIPFTKMQGAGNDFVIIDNTQRHFALNSEQIRQMADRHFGIGFDQLLLVDPPPTSEVDFSYTIYNANGSKAQQCGNGARCFGRFVYENELTSKKKLCLATSAGTIEVELQENNKVKVNMGVPVFELTETSNTYTLSAQSFPEPIKLGRVSMGNPHAVTQVESIEKAPVEELGQLLNQHPDFPEQVNVGFMQVLDAHSIRLRVYERGAGETLACGSGACAAVVIGRTQGLLAEDVIVCLSGGELFIHWEGKGSPVWMTGAAEFVFTGIYELGNT